MTYRSTRHEERALRLQVASAQYLTGQQSLQTVRASAVALHLNSKQLLSLDKALIQLRPASSASAPSSGHTQSPGASARPQQPSRGESQSADSPSSSIFDAFASSPLRSRRGAASPIKSPSKAGGTGLPAAAQPSSPTQFAGSPARVPVGGGASEQHLPVHSVVEVPPQTARRRPTLSPLVLDVESPPQTTAGAGSLPGVFVPRASPAASGAHCYHMGRS